MATTVFLTCDGYKQIHTVDGECDAPAECRRLELERNDWYAVIATQGGEIIADVDGYYDRDEMGAPDPFDLACERRWD